jgi:hypothetical protein
MVIDSALKTTEAEFGIEVRAQQDDISLFGDPDKIFGAGKALESILEKLSEVGLEPNKKKFQTFGTSANALVNKPDWLDAPFEITDPGDAARVAEAEAAASEAAARARNAHSEDADEATLAAAEAAEMARETRSQVPEEHRAYGVWICGAPIGSAGFIAIRLNRIRVRLCGSDTDGENTDQGELLSLISTLAAEDPHVAHTAIHYSVQNRVDFILQTNLPEETRTLAQAVDKSLSDATNSPLVLTCWTPVDLQIQTSVQIPLSFGTSSLRKSKQEVADTELLQNEPPFLTVSISSPPSFSQDLTRQEGYGLLWPQSSVLAHSRMPTKKTDGQHFTPQVASTGHNFGRSGFAFRDFGTLRLLMLDSRISPSRYWTQNLRALDTNALSFISPCLTTSNAFGQRA